MRAILFLVEDTLVPDQTLERWQWSWKPQGPAIPERHLRAAVKRALHRWDRRRWDGLTGAAPPVDAAAYREHLRDTLLEIAGHPLPEPEREAVVDRFLRAPVAAPFPEVPAALAAVRARGLVVAALSERPGPQVTETLHRAGLSPAIDRVVATSGEAVWLPAKAAFRAATSELGLRPSEVAFVGRLYWSDIRAAARAGLPALLLDRPEWWPRVAERRMRSLAEWPAALETGPATGPVPPAPEDAGGPEPSPPSPPTE